MTKHIHIWVHRAPARDAFEEAKHKRDDAGRFSTVPGKGDPNFHKAGINHSPAMKHHGEAEAHHHTKAQEEFTKNGDTPLHQAHKTAAKAHAMALEEAKQRATGFSGEGYENAAKKAANASKATQPNPLTDKPAASSFEPGQKEMEKHPNYNKDDHEYLKGKGWTNSQIHQRWTAEHKAGQGAASGKVKAPDVVGVVANPNFYKK